MSDAAVWVDPRRQGGQPCINHSRLPTDIVASLAWDAGVETVRRFYPQVSEEQVLGACWYEVVHGNRRSWRKRYADWPKEWCEDEWRAR